jgi:hypothetical protein
VIKVGLSRENSSVASDRYLSPHPASAAIVKPRT